MIKLNRKEPEKFSIWQGDTYMKLLQKTTLLEFLKSRTRDGERIYDRDILRTYAYDATVFALEKEESEKTFTEKRIEAATGINDLSQYTIMTSWLFPVNLSFIKTHNYDNIILIEKKLNVNKSNPEYKTIESERANLAWQCAEKARAFKIKSQIIRAEKIRKQEQANASYVKEKLTSQIVNFLKEELKQEVLNAEKIKDLSRLLYQVNNTTRVSNALLDFLKEQNFEIKKIIKLECSSWSKVNAKKRFKFEFEAPIWEVLQSGAFSSYLKFFLKETGESWHDNTDKFECNLEFLKFGI